jgi:hypothetical protein
MVRRSENTMRSKLVKNLQPHSQFVIQRPAQRGRRISSYAKCVESLSASHGFGWNCAVEILRPRSAGLWMTN